MLTSFTDNLVGTVYTDKYKDSSQETAIMTKEPTISPYDIFTSAHKMKTF
jgi:hypothetical protein